MYIINFMVIFSADVHELLILCCQNSRDPLTHGLHQSSEAKDLGCFCLARRMESTNDVEKEIKVRRNLG